MIRYKGGAWLYELRGIRQDNFEEANAMVISAGSRELFDREAEHELKKPYKERTNWVMRVAEEVVDLIKKYTTAGKQVYYMSPPIRANSQDQVELQLEESVDKVATRRNVEFKHIRTATLMARDMDKNGPRSTLAHWLEQDGIHMRPTVFGQLIDECLKENGWTVSKTGTADLKSRMWQMMKSEDKCRDCGRRGCQGDKCRNEKLYCSHCKKNNHDDRACSLLLYRPCKFCGLTTSHNRYPCKGWW
jgi:hypothetical protein